MQKGHILVVADFHFLQDRARFSQAGLFLHEKRCSIIALVDLHFVL